MSGFGVSNEAKVDIGFLGKRFLQVQAPLPGRGGSFRGKKPLFNEDEPRMNTNRHEYGWTSFNDKRHQNASAMLLLWYHFVSFVDNLLDIGCHPPPN